MEIGHLLGYGLDRYGNGELSRDRSHFSFPWKYCGKSTAGILQKGVQVLKTLQNVSSSLTDSYSIRQLPIQPIFYASSVG